MFEDQKIDFEFPEKRNKISLEELFARHLNNNFIRRGKMTCSQSNHDIRRCNCLSTTIMNTRHNIRWEQDEHLLGWNYRCLLSLIVDESDYRSLWKRKCRQTIGQYSFEKKKTNRSNCFDECLAFFPSYTYFCYTFSSFFSFLSFLSLSFAFLFLEFNMCVCVYIQTDYK